MQPPFEESALALIDNQRQRPPVTLRRLCRGPDAAQQVGARGVKQVIAVQVARERVDQREAHLRPLNHRDSHGPIQRNDGGWVEAFEKVV